MQITCGMKGYSRRRGPHDPVARKTTLGWVLSGPVKGERLNISQISVNFVVVGANEKSNDRNIPKLRNLDTLGIKQENEVDECFMQSPEKVTAPRF